MHTIRVLHIVIIIDTASLINQIHFLLEYVGVNPCFAEGEYLELLFAFDRQKNPVYLDETLDVYIEASEAALLDYQFSRMRK